MNQEPGQSSFDYYTEHAREFVSGSDKLKLFAAKMVFYVAAVYGAVTPGPYHFGLGAAGIALFWWLGRRPLAESKVTDESNPEVPCE
jgi:hypothetical protein